MYIGIVKRLELTAAVAAIAISVLSFNNLGVKELIKTKISGLLDNQSILQSQKGTLLNKVQELAGNVETLMGQKETLLNEKDYLLNQIEQLEININSLQEGFAAQKSETQKANDYIKEIQEYLNSIDIEIAPELEELPTYEIEELVKDVSDDTEAAVSDTTWDTNLNPAWNTFQYEGLNFQLGEKDGEKVLWFLDNREDSQKEVNVVAEYIGIDDEVYTLTLEDCIFNKFDIQPKSYHQIIISYSDGTEKMIKMI